MKIFFDTEFTGLHKDTTLISIGLISEDRRCFYAELTDYKRTLPDVDNWNWIEENVIANLYKSKSEDDRKYISNYHIGTKDDIALALGNWFSQFDKVELVSDVCHYDMVLLIDLFGTAFDLPDNVSASCYDINARSLIGVFAIAQGKEIEVQAISSDESVISSFIEDMKKFEV